MATLIILSGPDGPLTSLSIPLRRGEQSLRSFYALPGFMKTMEQELPKWVTGKLEAPQSPQEQFRGILRRWNANRPRLEYDRHFKDLMPGRDEVWEMKSPDLRFFGWMYKPCVFIGSILGYADWYKRPRPLKSYEDAREGVLRDRGALDLDPPKFEKGTFDALVSV